jgi:hypothetical protein
VEEIAPIATDLVLQDREYSFRYLTLMTFRELTVRVWYLIDMESADVADDYIREIAKRDAASAIAVVHPAPLPPDSGGDRGYNVAVECTNGKYDSLIVVRDGPTEREFRIIEYTYEDPEYKWFHVDPRRKIELTFRGPVKMELPGGDA